ncbi:putative nuclease HARBI1 [Pecten maximus]|uniref:putative nuclease HARBI1 n=1 Tax=Pecten maximus TaxID=6579 RepID=UPI001458A1C1|nr:putative nuclease HARBI1 [Pecten maximus]
MADNVLNIGLVSFLIADSELQDDESTRRDKVMAQGGRGGGGVFPRQKVFEHSFFFCRLREKRYKIEGFYEETINMYLPDTFKRFFRISRETFEILLQHLIPLMGTRTHPGGRPEVPTEKKILMTLRYMASQETTLELSHRFDVSESTFLRARSEVIDIINNHLLVKFRKWPENGELPDIAQTIDDLGRYNFPNVVGAVDGCHIPIEAPNRNPQSYYNRKKFHSIILQGVCRENRMFININVGWPGRVHDAKVLRNSQLWGFGFRKCRNGQFHLLGDAAYPIRRWLLTPYRDTGHLSRKEMAYNRALSSKRQVIERAFALLKGRFRRLKYINVRSIIQICRIITCACVLHNICILHHDGMEDFLSDDVDEVDAGDGGIRQIIENDAEGVMKRLVITNQLRN